MKKNIRWIFTTAVLSLWQCAVAQSEIVGVPLETENLNIIWADDYDEKSMDSVKRKSEALYRETVNFLQIEPSDRVTVVFRGRARTGPGPNRDYSFVDSTGVVSLYRFTDDPENYFHAFVHELVHALRIDRAEEADWFFEEGFAEFVRLRVYEPMEGFPWHGFASSIVAAGHIVEGSAIPLDAIRDQHEQLNIRCRAQVYALRSAFFEWLGDNFGDELILNMSLEDVTGREFQYEEYFGHPFSKLTEQWLKDIQNTYDAEKFREYRTNTPIRFIPLCEV